jgi:hypothetical protein
MDFIEDDGRTVTAMHVSDTSDGWSMIVRVDF